MGLPAINITFTPIQLTNIDAALAALEANCPFRVNVPAGEKNEDQAMNVKRYPFVADVINNIAPSRPDLQPGYLPFPDAVNDHTLYDQFTPRVQRLASILESYTDTQYVAGVEDYFYFRKFYAIVQEAATANVPGADAILQNLKRLYEEQGPDAPTP